jgi:hypothetical protein
MIKQLLLRKQGSASDHDLSSSHGKEQFSQLLKYKLEQKKLEYKD